MEQEIVKLLNVLRRIARAASYAAWTKPGLEATEFCAAQYNRVLARLTEIEPAIKPLFAPLNDSVSPEVTRMSARELLAYFEADEPELVRGFGGAFYLGCSSHREKVKCIPIALTCE